MTYGWPDCYLFGGIVDFLSCWFGDFLSQIRQAGVKSMLSPSSIALQPSHPLPRIINLSYARVSVLPEVEEFLVAL